MYACLDYWKEWTTEPVSHYYTEQVSMPEPHKGEGGPA
jgi:hypothetical protein